MNLQLAFALSCTDTDCQVQSLDEDTRFVADFSEPIKEYGITIKPGDLIAVDRGAYPPQVLFRWELADVVQIENEQIYVDCACGRSQPLARGEGLQVNVGVGDKVFVAYGEVHDISVGGRPANPEHFRAALFPMIQAMYQRLEARKDLDPKQVVEEGYDHIAERYLEWIQTTRAEERTLYTSVLLNELPFGAEVLDLGCGAGVPTTQELARRFKVTGVDISERQVALAQENVPESQFIQTDITQLDSPPASFDAVAAFYTLIHVPRQEQPNLLQDIASWLRPGGLLVATMGTLLQSRRHLPMRWS
jgi:precorrin-6B methylase 2